jgi:hypothetical protein
LIDAAMKAFHDNTCIKFIPLDGDSDDYIIIRKKVGEG